MSQLADKQDFPEAKPLNDVAKFHTTFDHPILDKAQIPDAKRCALRISLLQEELNELKEAIEQNDLVEVADAFCDIQYVLSGAIHEFGLGSQFKKLFDEVQRSNMSKACETEAIAKETVEYYTGKKNTPCHYVEKNGKFLVYRDADQKTLKSVAYSPAKIKELLF